MEVFLSASCLLSEIDIKHAAQPSATIVIPESPAQALCFAYRLRRVLEPDPTIFSLTAKVDHPHVCRLLDVYESEKSLDLVMECLEGGELYQRVNAGKFAESGQVQERSCGCPTRVSWHLVELLLLRKRMQQMQHTRCCWPYDICTTWVICLQFEHES